MADERLSAEKEDIKCRVGRVLRVERRSGTAQVTGALRGRAHHAILLATNGQKLFVDFHPGKRARKRSFPPLVEALNTSCGNPASLDLGLL